MFSYFLCLLLFSVPSIPSLLVSFFICLFSCIFLRFSWFSWCSFVFPCISSPYHCFPFIPLLHISLGHDFPEFSRYFPDFHSFPLFSSFCCSISSSVIVFLFFVFVSLLALVSWIFLIYIFLIFFNFPCPHFPVHYYHMSLFSLCSFPLFLSALLSWIFLIFSFSWIFLVFLLISTFIAVFLSFFSFVFLKISWFSSYFPCFPHHFYHYLLVGSHFCPYLSRPWFSCIFLFSWFSFPFSFVFFSSFLWSF